MARAHLILDRYEPIGTAGSGGFGTVQIAWDPRIQRKVAIKTIQLTEQDAYRAALPGAQAVSRTGSDSAGTATAGASGASTADRWHGVQPWSEFLEEDDRAHNANRDDSSDFDQEPETFHALAHLPGLDEARTAAMLSDPRIVTVFDFEVRDRTAYLIMEYIEGITLTQIMREYVDWLSLDAVGAVFDAVSGALIAAHDAGVLHLDIKPDNILINAKGEVKVTDFGLATLADASGAGTTGGGTIGYMPLEQMRREHLDARTDEWSLAAVTYEMLTGENPFLAKGLDEAESAIEDAELVLPSLCWEDIDEQIDDVIFYALDPDREERYDTVADFAEEAEKFLGNPMVGKDELADIVEDALGLSEELEDEWRDDDLDRDASPAGPGVLGFLKSMFDRDDYAEEAADAPRARNAMPLDYQDFDEEDDEYYEDATPTRSRVRERGSHKPLREKPGVRARGFLARAFAAVASGAIALLAAANLTALQAFGSGWIAVVAAFALAVAGLAIVRPYIGTLASFALLAVSLVANSAFIPAIVLLAAVAAWWYFVGRESVAASNVALASPIVGAVGAASVAPLIAGIALRPVQAVATTAFSAVVALVLGAFGSGSLLGWDAASHWLVGQANVTSAFFALATKSTTWLVVAGWLVASLVCSLLSTSGKRWANVAGVIVGAIIAIAVPVAVFGPSLQLIVPLLIGAAVLLAVML